MTAMGIASLHPSHELKGGINGMYHHVSEAHPKRYLAEFDFRYNNRAKLGIKRWRKSGKGPLGYRRQASHDSRLDESPHASAEGAAVPFVEKTKREAATIKSGLIDKERCGNATIAREAYPSAKRGVVLNPRLNIVNKLIEVRNSYKTIPNYLRPVEVRCVD